MMYVLLVVGFVLLIKGADFFVDGASAVARLLRVPSVIIGLTIVAMGTSAPEAAVSITAGLAGSNEIAVSNVIGSNIFNLLVVAGVCAVMKPFAVERSIMKRDFPLNILFCLILMPFIFAGILPRWGGIVLLMCMAMYLVLTIMSALKNRTSDDEESNASGLFTYLSGKLQSLTGRQKLTDTVLSIVFCVVGLWAVICGGDMVVDNARLIAKSMGLSDTLIGLTIVAIGTSLPELVTSIAAARRGNNDMAMGNVIGSNIFNLIFILGMSAVLNPISIANESIADVLVMTAATAMMFVFSRTKGKLERGEGAFCILVYAAYTAYIIIR